MYVRKFIVISIVLFTTICYGQEIYKEKRKTMVSKQLKARGITNKATLQAMLDVPRHLFVPEKMKDYAYADSPLPIGNQQTISQPYIVAFMTQELKLRENDKVLEIGTGSGYQAAVLCKIVHQVFTIEIIEALGNEAKNRLQQLGYPNVNVRIGDGYNGWPEEAPFDAIMVTAGAQQIPQPLIDQLGEGGRMIIPVGQTTYLQQLVLITKKNGKIRQENKLGVRFVPFTRNKEK
ncbi:MAG: protein-L-isoaspartate(D-aspartate) O-methyltransferase [Flavobacteriaceae bacterium]|nr:protein-L-isoaspartate(D-aspartate) O-methyltransferase [Flavobacteriaceae bacterium]